MLQVLEVLEVLQVLEVLEVIRVGEGLGGSQIFQNFGTMHGNSEKFLENPGQALVIIGNSRRAKRAENFFRGFTICHSKSRKSVR